MSLNLPPHSGNMAPELSLRNTPGKHSEHRVHYSVTGHITVFVFSPASFLAGDLLENRDHILFIFEFQKYRTLSDTQ